MRWIVGTLAVFAVVALAGIMPVRAEEEPGSDREALAEIAEALDRIAEVLERQLDSSRLELLMHRVSVSRGRLEGLEARLRAAKQDYDEITERKARVESQYELLIEQASTAETSVADALAVRIQQLEDEIELGETMLATRAEAIALLESEIARRGRDLEEWQAYVDRELDGL